MENAKFCPHCGTELDAGVKFCPKCGYKLTSEAATQANATQTTTEANKTAQSAQSTGNTNGNGGFSERLDAMVNWVANNWVTAIIIVAALLIFTLVTRAIFYNVWLGVIALIAVLAWLYSVAWTRGSGATGFEQKLRHTANETAKQTAKAAKTVNNDQTNSEPIKQATETTDTASQAPAQPQLQQASANAQATMAEQAPAQPAGQSSGNTVYIQQAQQRSNGLGTAGFVLALISLFTSIIPIVDWVVWFLGALFSFIGLFRKPRGLAIAGFVISFIGVIIILTLAATIAGMLGMM
ncbi:zinc ribbon domain-containing protein [Levilactobacillus angrenensis]|uniref:Zinc-ribbon domain-containing protein n=1 Tax=Levilactobacillus angrenensis TaxID=2486020 RepID=A0ABW1U8G6_9LACO|nr:zinc ribbon domain-containing protein [Levilactobacillus angrenensis]